MKREPKSESPAPIMQCALVTKWRDAYFQPECAPSVQWIKNMIKKGVYSGEKIGGAWYIHVYANTLMPVQQPDAPPRSPREELTSTGNALADAVIDDWLKVG